MIDFDLIAKDLLKEIENKSKEKQTEIVSEFFRKILENYFKEMLGTVD